MALVMIYVGILCDKVLLCLIYQEETVISMQNLELSEVSRGQAMITVNSGMETCAAKLILMW